MRVLFLTDGPESPSGRFRCEQLFPHLERRGIECVERYSYGRHYNSFGVGRLKHPYRAICRLRRATHTVFGPRADLVFFQRTALSFSALPEQLRSLYGAPTIFDFDDALHLDGRGAPDELRSRAFRRAVSASTWIIAGNRYLASLTGRPDSTTVIPSVVDTDLLLPQGTGRPSSGPIVGWMGTASNFVHLRMVLEDVGRAVRAVPGAKLRIVSNEKPREADGSPWIEFIPWSEARELELLRSFDIGLMPLMDADVSRGKCAFKLLQYMSVGKPVVASAVGANIEVLDGVGAGTLVPPGQAWTAPLLTLLRQREALSDLGVRGRQRVVSHYSVASVVGDYVDLFKELVSRSG